MKMFIRLFSIILFFATFVFLSPVAAQTNCDSAEDPLGVGCGTASGLSNTDPRFVVARIINATLGLLGAIVLGLMVYAGFLWTTSAGNEERVTQAKHILYGAVIGLAIIMSAYTISYFVIRSLSSATGMTRSYTL